jgi:SNF2 family DNA or RNA helicase
MGLGKTIQVISFISGLIYSKLSKYFLIVLPLSLIQNWKNEFETW